MLVDVSHVDAGTDLLGYRSAMPLMLSPTGMSQLFHASGEAAVARAAIAAGMPYGLSKQAATSIAAIAVRTSVVEGQRVTEQVSPGGRLILDKKKDSTRT